MRISDWSSDVCSSDLHLTGRVAGWREDAGWRIATPALRIDGTGYGADVRGGLTFEGDGTRPRIDIAARLDDTQVPVAKRFWVRNKMSEATLHWLDTALVDGRLLRSEEHTSELQSLMRNSYAVFCLKKKTTK